MALHRCGAENGVGLRAGIAELLQIFDGIEAGLAISHVCVEIILLAGFVHRYAFEDQVLLVFRLQCTGLEDGILHAVFGDTALDDVDLDVNPAGHLNGAAEGDFAIALREVQVAHRQTAALDVDREIHLRAAGEIFDVAVAAMFARRHGTGGLHCGSLGRIGFHTAHVRGAGRSRCGERRYTVGIGRYQCGLAFVPGVEQGFGGQAADQTGMHDTGETHSRYMARRGIDAFQVPDGFVRVGVVLGEKTAAVFAGEQTGKSPLGIFERTDIQDIDHQQIAGFDAFHTDRAGQVVNLGEIHIAHVIGGIVVGDLRTGPVHALHDEIVTRFYPCHHGNVRMPTIVNAGILFRCLGKIDFDQCIGHDSLRNYSEDGAVHSVSA